MAIILQEVKTKWQQYKFAKFGNDLYKDCEEFCPHLLLDEMNTFNPAKDPSYDVCESVQYLAYRDGQIVGRVAGIINRVANERWGVKKVRFGWIDFIDDYEVSRALLDAVAAWGKSKGMNQLNGPVGFTDWDYEGLLIEGFEYLAPMASLYNFPYYEKHMEAYGLTKENDWIEIQITDPQCDTPERVLRIDKLVRERYHLRVDKVHSAKELERKYGMEYMDMLDESYQKLYNFQPMTPRQKEHYKNTYFPLLNFDFVTIVVNDKNEIVGVGLGMPDISQALRRCKGRLFPFGWIGVLRALKAKKMEAFDLLLIGVRPDYQGLGVNAVIIAEQHPYYRKYGIKRVETTSIMETNTRNIANFLMFPHKQHKRRRAYKKTI
ncbi:MAG: N-acetyltransferase [Paludibacteraceae bacterium]|nr:N-acetyltransferase [Paludibacteraceae bacterium]